MPWTTSSWLKMALLDPTLNHRKQTGLAPEIKDSSIETSEAEQGNCTAADTGDTNKDIATAIWNVRKHTRICISPRDPVHLDTL